MTGPAVVVGAYLLGSLPVLYAIGWLRGYDLRGVDQHITLWRQVGRAEGLVGVAWDIAKGALVVFVARRLELGVSWVALAGLAAVFGQMWPLLLWRLGEKGKQHGPGRGPGLFAGSRWHGPYPDAYGGCLAHAAPLEAGQKLERAATVRRTVQPQPAPGSALYLCHAAFGQHLAGRGPGDRLGLWRLLVAIMARRLTAGLGLRDLREGRAALLNRLLYDRDVS